MKISFFLKDYLTILEQQKIDLVKSQDLRLKNTFQFQARELAIAWLSIKIEIIKSLYENLRFHLCP